MVPEIHVYLPWMRKHLRIIYLNIESNTLNRFVFLFYLKKGNVNLKILFWGIEFWLLKL